MHHETVFPYHQAFARNLGWFTEWEQLALRGKCVAIAGLGGVGGVYLLTLARLGVERFAIADPDSFEFVNFNRQVGANVDSVGRPKADVLEEMALGINPELCIRRFDRGVTSEDVNDFLRGAHLFVDGFDFFELGIRRQVFARCAELGIPAITAAPIGMGVGFLAFVPGGMTFEEYFRLEGHPLPEQYLRFLMGVAPRGLHRKYLVDPTRVDIAGRKGPSTIAACQLCAGVTAVAAAKLLLGRGDVQPAPVHHHFDPYLNRYARTRLRAGNAGRLQKVKLAVARRIYARAAGASPAPGAAEEWTAGTVTEEILNLARWAPSGCNAQPWRVRIAGDWSATVRLHAPRLHGGPDYRDGEPAILSLGMFLESLRIAASHWSRRVSWELAAAAPLEIRVRFDTGPDLAPHPLLSALTLRATDRRPYRRRPLIPAEKDRLAGALGDDLAIAWQDSTALRLRIGRLHGAATRLRLCIPEHRAADAATIDWRRDQSPDGVPLKAAAHSWLARRLLQRTLPETAERTGAPARLLLPAATDTVPYLRSAAAFAVTWADGSDRPRSVEAVLRAGERLQRFWLTATQLGLALQPATAALAFAHTAAEAGPAPDARIARLGSEFRRVVGTPAGSVVFMGRIGEPYGRQIPRASRLPVTALAQRAEAPDEVLAAAAD